MYRVTQSVDGISIDQAPYATGIIASILGKDWTTRYEPGVKPSIPFHHTGTEYEAALVTETPFDLPALIAAEIKYGFKYRSILYSAVSCILIYGLNQISCPVVFVYLDSKRPLMGQPTIRPSKKPFFLFARTFNVLALCIVDRLKLVLLVSVPTSKVIPTISLLSALNLF